MEYIYFDSINSTNAYLKVKHHILDDWTVVATDYQVSGHGRLSRLWESQKGKNLLCSVLLKDKATLKNASSLSLVTGVVIFQTLTKLGLKGVKIKWPNDIYVNDKKICGILLEGKSSGDTLNAVIIGIGLNLNQKKFPKGLNATSYINEKKKSINVKRVLKMIMDALYQEIDRLNHHQSNYLKIINDHNYLYNKEAYVTLKGKKTLVKILTINKDNSLLVIHNKKKVSVTADEVTLS